MGAALDAAAFGGNGTGMPTGLLHTTGVSLASGTSFAAATAAALLKTVADSNVPDDVVAFVAPPAVRQTLSVRAGNGTGSEFLWRGDALLGKRAFASASLPASTVYCGDFSQIVIPLWSGAGLQLEVDRRTAFQADIIGVKATLYADVAVLRPAAFAIGTGVT